MDSSFIPNIEAKLKSAFPDAEFNLQDYKHDGAHFVLNISSSRFKNLNLVEQHRLVYSTLAEFLKSGQLHALRLKTSAK